MKRTGQIFKFLFAIFGMTSLTARGIKRKHRIRSEQVFGYYDRSRALGTNNLFSTVSLSKP